MNLTLGLTWSLTFAKLLLLLAPVLLTVHLVTGHECLKKCQCLYQNNKLMADCSQQMLTTLPMDTDSPDVQTINLAQNSFPELKRNLFSNSNLINLQKINLRKVGLEKVDEKSFHNLNNLIELDLSLNNMKYIPSQSFSTLVKLRSLDMSSNLIPSVPNHSFLNLTNLKSLSLEKNRITFIDDNAFQGLVNLESLKLSENYVINIGSKTLVPLIQVHSLTLGENKWKCDCRMRSVRKFLLANTRINILDEPKCVDSHKVWTQLGLDSFLCPPVISNLSSSNLNVNEGSTLRLECVIILSEEEDIQPSILWYWQNIPISNNSRGCGEDCLIHNKTQQYFLITETFQTNKKLNQKLKISRLELSSVLSFNSGPYVCIAQNNAGKDNRVFKIAVTAQDPQRKVTSAAAASSESHYVNDNQNNNLKEESETDKVVIGLILGILFGIFLVLVLFGISVIMFCRRRRQKQSNNRNNSVTDGTELEKLTLNSNSSLKVNPIQKPPRMAMDSYHSGLPLDPYHSDKEIPQVWLIKHNINGNFGPNVRHNQSYAESDYSTQLLFNDNYDSNASDVLIEPDLIHPSAYVRERHIQVTDLDQLSLHSDGTEV